MITFSLEKCLFVQQIFVSLPAKVENKMRETTKQFGLIIAKVIVVHSAVCDFYSADQHLKALAISVLHWLLLLNKKTKNSFSQSENKSWKMYKSHLSVIWPCTINNCDAEFSNYSNELLLRQCDWISVCCLRRWE